MTASWRFMFVYTTVEIRALHQSGIGVHEEAVLKLRRELLLIQKSSILFWFPFETRSTISTFDVFVSRTTHKKQYAFSHQIHFNFIEFYSYTVTTANNRLFVDLELIIINYILYYNNWYNCCYEDRRLEDSFEIVFYGMEHMPTF